METLLLKVIAIFKHFSLKLYDGMNITSQTKSFIRATGRPIERNGSKVTDLPLQLGQSSVDLN